MEAPPAPAPPRNASANTGAVSANGNAAATDASWLLHDSALRYGDGTGGWLPPHSPPDKDHHGRHNGNDEEGGGIPPPPPGPPPPLKTGAGGVHAANANANMSNTSAEQPSWLHLSSSSSSPASDNSFSSNGNTNANGNPNVHASNRGRVSARFASALLRSGGGGADVTSRNGAKVLQARAEAKSLMVGGGSGGSGGGGSAPSSRRSSFASGVGGGGGIGKGRKAVPPPPPGPPPPPVPQKADAGKKADSKAGKSGKTKSKKASVVVPPPPPPGPPPPLKKVDSKLGGIFRRASKAAAQQQQQPPPAPPPSTAMASVSTPRNADANGGNVNGNTAAAVVKATPASARTAQTAPSTGRMSTSSSSLPSASGIRSNSTSRRSKVVPPPPPLPDATNTGTGSTKGREAAAKTRTTAASGRNGHHQRTGSATTTADSVAGSPIVAKRLGFASPRPTEAADTTCSTHRTGKVSARNAVGTDTATAAPVVRSARSSGRRSWGQSVRDYHSGSGGTSGSNGVSGSGGATAKARSSARRAVRKDAPLPAAGGAATPATIVEEADTSPNDASLELNSTLDDTDGSMMRSILSVSDEGDVEVSVSQFSRVSVSASSSSASASASASTSTSSSRWGRSVRGAGAGSSSRWGGVGGADRGKTRRERKEPEPTAIASSAIPPPPPPLPVPAHLRSADRHVGRIVLLQSVARRWLVRRRLEREAAVAAMCNSTVDTADLLNTTPVPVSAEKEGAGTAIPTSLLGKFGFDDSNEVEDSLLFVGGVDSSVDYSGDVDGGLTARRLEREQREAATVIQTAHRASVERTKYAQLLSKRDGAATTIQSSVRAASVRRDFCKAIEAAVLIQSLARGTAKRREIEQQHQAATIIQARVRGMAGREEIIRYCTHIEQMAAATKIQSSYRGSKQRQSFARQAGAVVGIQALIRGCLDRKSLAHQAEAATTIQAFARASRSTKVESNNSTKEDRAARIAKAEVEAKRLESTSPVDDSDADRATPVLSSTSVDSNSGSDGGAGLVGSDASCSDASSVDVESEIAQAFDIGQQALRSAPEEDEFVTNNDQDTKGAKEEIDEANILKAKHFLTHPGTVSLPMEEKSKYLLSKGLNESEIKASVEAVAQELILEQGLLYDDMGTKVTLETSLNVKNDELKKQKDPAGTESNASTSTADKSSLELPRGDSVEDTFDAETKANKSGLNTSVLSQTFNKSIERMKQVEVKLPSCCCLPSHLPNRVVIGLLVFVILLAIGLYLIYTFAVGSLS